MTRIHWCEEICGGGGNDRRRQLLDDYLYDVMNYTNIGYSSSKHRNQRIRSISKIVQPLLEQSVLKMDIGAY